MTIDRPDALPPAPTRRRAGVPARGRARGGADGATDGLASWEASPLDEAELLRRARGQFRLIDF